MALFNLKLKFFIFGLFFNILINSYIINIHRIREKGSSIGILWPCSSNSQIKNNIMWQLEFFCTVNSVFYYYFPKFYPVQKPLNKFFIIFVKLKLKLSFNIFIKAFPFHFPFAVMWKLIRYTHFCNSSKKTSITRQIYRQPGILIIMPVQ